jgi:hypothetical protein
MKARSADVFNAARKLVELLDEKKIAHEKCDVITPSGEHALSTTKECFSLAIDVADAKWDLISVCDRYADDK